MATVSAVSAVAERLEYLLLADGAPARCVGDLRDGVVQLRSELRAIVFAADSIDSMSEELRNKVTQLAYDIEDAVECYSRQEAAHEEKLGVRCCLSTCSSTSARRLSKYLHIIRERINDIKHFMDAKKYAAAGGGLGESFSSSISASSNAEPQRDRQLILAETTCAHGELILGMEEDRRRLMDNLTDGSGTPKLTVTAICGMGGIGKTTLARSLYDDAIVADYFDNRAWVTVEMDYGVRKIVEDIASCTWDTSTDEIPRFETMMLVQLLYRSRMQKRYLVVLDDVWSTEVWDTLKFAFPDDHNGSRIIITTRLMDVAHHLATYIHTTQPLNEKQSWELFKLKFSGKKDRGTELGPQMEKIGKQLVQQCRGLPLAIATISGVLRRMDFNGWVKVLERLQRDPHLELIEVSLAQSYHALSFHLKPCFLYLGHFPPDQAIPVDKLCLLWMAEGLISMRDSPDRRKMEVAEEYFRELVYRSPLSVAEMEPVLDSVRTGSCQLYDKIRGVCIHEGKQDDFFEIIDFDKANGRLSRTHRLAIYLHKYKDMNDLLEIPADVKRIIRSILFYDADTKPLSNSTWPKELSDLKEFQGTRVLDFNKVDFQIRKLPRGIDKLTYLRYLSFGGCYLSAFPASLSNFPFLETLDLRVRVSCVMTIPNVLRKLSNLRHLYFPLACRSATNDKLKLNSLKKLQVLEYFPAGVCDADDLLQLENLEIFTGIMDGNNIDLEKTIIAINGMKSLCRSSLVVKAFDSYSEERRSIVTRLLEHNAIHSLDIEGYLGVFPRLDKGISSNFTEIIFNGSEFGEDPMPILGKLPNLRSLVLCNDAFLGMIMTCSEGGFPQLASLKLATLQFLVWLEVEKGSMPKLNILTIEQCDKLRTYPLQLIQTVTPQKFMIGSMREEYQSIAKLDLKRMKDLATDEPTITFYDC